MKALEAKFQVKIYKLDLSGKYISFIPPELYQLDKLEVLDLSNNKISYIDNKIFLLTNLKILDLS